MDIYRIQFGKNLKLALKAAGITQATLAEMLDVEPSTVSRWANGNDFPDEGRLPRIAKLLGRTVPELTGTSTTRRMAEVMTKPSPLKPWDLTPKLMVAALGWLVKAKPVRRALVLYLLSEDEAFLEALPEDETQSLSKILKVT